MNSNSSHGNVYVLADTQQSRRHCSDWEHLSIRRPWRAMIAVAATAAATATCLRFDRTMVLLQVSCWVQQW